MIQTDKQATAARRFEDDRSKILKDGREICYGEDWKRRKSELWQRCGGKCEYWRVGYQRDGQVRVERCQSEAEDPHHLEKRSIKRDDRLERLIALCRFHHNLQHPEMQPKWTKRQGEAA